MRVSIADIILPARAPRELYNSPDDTTRVRKKSVQSPDESSRWRRCFGFFFFFYLVYFSLKRRNEKNRQQKAGRTSRTAGVLRSSDKIIVVGLLNFYGTINHFFSKTNGTDQSSCVHIYINMYFLLYTYIVFSHTINEFFSNRNLTTF